MTGDKITAELLDEASWEIGELRGSYLDSQEAIVPMHLLRRLHEAVVWAADEIIQLREDLIGSTGACRSLTEENLDLNGQVTILSTLVGLGYATTGA